MDPCIQDQVQGPVDTPPSRPLTPAPPGSCWLVTQARDSEQRRLWLQISHSDTHQSAQGRASFSGCPPPPPSSSSPLPPPEPANGIRRPGVCRFTSHLVRGDGERQQRGVIS